MRIKLQLSAVVTGWIMKSLTGAFLCFTSMFSCACSLQLSNETTAFDSLFQSMLLLGESTDIGHSTKTWLISMS